VAVFAENSLHAGVVALVTELLPLQSLICLQPSLRGHPSPGLAMYPDLNKRSLAGNRGTISHKAINELRKPRGAAWITTLKSAQIRAPVQGDELQPGCSPGATKSALGSAKSSTSTKSVSTLHSRSSFEFERLEYQIAAEAALDGLYVIRTRVAKKQMSSADAVRSYKALANVERAFCSMKTIDLDIRPINHRVEGQHRAICQNA
jgi:hypothetical protein